jgi:hypothetical protein
MNLSEVMPLSLEGFRQELLAQEPISTPDTYTDPTIQFFNGLKAPYIASQIQMRQRLKEDGEMLSWCQQELLGNTGRRKELKLLAKGHQLEIGELEAGLNWASAKIRDLDEQMAAAVILRQASLL